MFAGKKKRGTTTPFDMVVRNDLDRFHRMADVFDRVLKPGPIAAYGKQAIRDKLVEHREYITKYGQNMPEIGNGHGMERSRRDQEGLEEDGFANHRAYI
jgi:xylulose-5-phosphate/fructose-6-phosphate phosphoketolase